MSDYKVGDTVYLEAKIVGFDKHSQFPYQMKLSDGRKFWMSSGFSIPDNVQETYKDGLNDAWELANKVINSKLVSEEYKKYFGLDIGFRSRYDLTKALFEMGYEELKTRFEAYENKTKIKVGDVVFNTVNKQYAVVVVVGRDSATVIEKFGDNLQIHTPSLKALEETNKKVDITGILTEIEKDEDR